MEFCGPPKLPNVDDYSISQSLVQKYLNHYGQKRVDVARAKKRSIYYFLITLVVIRSLADFNISTGYIISFSIISLFLSFFAPREFKLSFPNINLEDCTNILKFLTAYDQYKINLAKYNAYLNQAHEQNIRAMTGSQFEQLAAAFLADKFNCKTRTTGGSGDDGIDIMLLDKNTRPIGLAQCKAHNQKKIPPSVLRQLLGSKVHSERTTGSTIGICVIVSIEGLSRQAEDFASRNAIQSYNIHHLIAWRYSRRRFRI